MRKYVWILSAAVLAAGCADENSPTASVCDEGAARCGDEVVEICTDNQWTVKAHCDNGCKGGKCIESSTPGGTCQEGDLQCSGKRVQICQDNVWTTQTECKNGCANGKCLSEDLPETCDEGALRCQKKVVQTCRNNTWLKSETCSYDCEYGTCIEKDEYSCDNVTCGEGKICSIGRCIDKAEEEDTCDVDEFVERCTDSMTVQYCDRAWVSDFACLKNSQYTESCQVFPYYYEATGLPYADCIDAKDACESGAADRYICYQANSDKKYYTQRQRCIRAASGQYFYVGSVNDEEACPAGCNTDNTACAVSEVCNVASYSASCSGNVLSYCNINTGKSAIMDCSDVALGSTCQAFKDGRQSGVDYASCFSEGSQCTKENETKTICSEGDESAVVKQYRCMKSTSGKRYWVLQEQTSCNRGESCNDTLTACAKAETCEVGQYDESCSGQIGKYCYDGKTAHFNCDSYTAVYGEKYTCQTFNHAGFVYADCVSKGEICTQPGTSSTVCKDSSSGAMLVTSHCESSQTGSRSYFISPDDPKACAEGETCNTSFNQCVKAQTCTSSTHPTCDGAAYSYCDTKTKKMINRNCKDLGEHYVCASNGTTAGCFETCERVGAQKTVCLDPFGFGTFAVVSYQCTSIGSGNYWVGTDQAPIACANGCNIDATDCL